MKSSVSILIAASASGLCLLSSTSCGQKNPDDVKPEISQAVGDVGDAARKAGGDYSKMLPADQKKVLEMARGNEKVAKGLVYSMAHPPSEMNAGKGGNTASK